MKWKPGCNVIVHEWHMEPQRKLTFTGVHEKTKTSAKSSIPSTWTKDERKETWMTVFLFLGKTPQNDSFWQSWRELGCHIRFVACLLSSAFLQRIFLRTFMHNRAIRTFEGLVPSWRQHITKRRMKVDILQTMEFSRNGIQVHKMGIGYPEQSPEYKAPVCRHSTP